MGYAYNDHPRCQADNSKVHLVSLEPDYSGLVCDRSEAPSSGNDRRPMLAPKRGSGVPDAAPLGQVLRQLGHKLADEGRQPLVGDSGVGPLDRGHEPYERTVAAIVKDGVLQEPDLGPSLIGHGLSPFDEPIVHQAPRVPLADDQAVDRKHRRRSAGVDRKGTLLDGLDFPAAAWNADLRRMR